MPAHGEVHRGNRPGDNEHAGIAVWPEWGGAGGGATRAQADLSAGGVGGARSDGDLPEYPGTHRRGATDGGGDGARCDGAGGDEPAGNDGGLAEKRFAADL